MKSPIYTEEYLKSKEFNYLTFVSTITAEKGKGRCLWRCRCGKEFPYRKNDIVSGAKKSCGCVAFPKGKKSHHWKGCGELSGMRWGIILTGAKNRKIEISIAMEDAWKQFLKQNRKCALTGEELHFDTSWKVRDCTASLDRIDSTKGYTPDNIQWVHQKVNMMKNCYSQIEFIFWCKKVSEHILGLDNPSTPVIV